MSTTMIFIRLIALASIVLAVAAGGGAVSRPRSRTKRKVALMTASVPWGWGPYQSQLHHLSLLLDESSSSDDIEYDLYWLCFAESIPHGVYHTYEELRPTLPASQNEPPADFQLDHLTFLGFGADPTKSASKLNALQSMYGFDCLITLFDVAGMIPDEPFRMPVVAWVPLHSEIVRSTTSDFWSLRHHHGVAALAPSGARAVAESAGKKLELNTDITDLIDAFGRSQVDFVPHIFDRTAIATSAAEGLKVLNDWSVALADSILTESPLIVGRGQESTLESGHPHSLFGTARNDDFVVLMQGGNYDKEDRKGWDTSIQAYALFYKSLDVTARSKVHLLLHSMESYLISSDRNGDIDPPPSVMPIGLNLRLLLHEHGLPPDAYTVDIARHAPQVKDAFKLRADVCLHPSKVEGFGMNVMECQAVGTPVITTNYTAMGDYTMIGRSVPHRQMIRAPGQLYEVALPDVEGITAALHELHEQHLAMKGGDEQALSGRKQEVDDFNTWIEKKCSPRAVERKFRALLDRAYVEFESREGARSQLLSGAPPDTGAFEVAKGYHSPIVDWHAPWTLLAPDNIVLVAESRLHQMAWMHLLQTNPEGGGPPPLALIVPAKYEDGTEVPVFNSRNDGLHEDATLLVRTVVVADMQGQVTRRSSLAMKAITSTGRNPTGLPEGMLVVDRKQGQQRGIAWPGLDEL